MTPLNPAKISIDHLKLKPASPVAVGNLTKSQFDVEMRIGMNDMASGRIISADDVESEMKKFCT